jgi:FixJ family two-component response regulator
VLTVYIVEDEPSVRRSLQRLLNSAGLSVHVFKGVEELVSAELETRDACVIADIDLGGSTALGLPARLKESGRALPVIFITAWDSPETRASVRVAGGAGYFRKPVDDQALLDAIEWAISGAERKLN